LPKHLTAIVFLGLLSCNSTKNLSGVYRSNFAVAGFFSTLIRFKPNNSLQFVSWGDLRYDSTVGHYKICDNKLYITFKKIDLNAIGTGFNFDLPVQKALFAKDTIQYQSFYYIGNNKLFPANIETGKKGMKAWGYFRFKKYILFGRNWYYKRYYLKCIKQSISRSRI
jgi:hypothetical protein